MTFCRRCKNQSAAPTPDAAIFYLAKILEGGDLLGACRRLQVIACEDIGLAYPRRHADSARLCRKRKGAWHAGGVYTSLRTQPYCLQQHPSPTPHTLPMPQRRPMSPPARARACQTTCAPRTGFKTTNTRTTFPATMSSSNICRMTLSAKNIISFGENKVEQAAAEYWNRIKSKDNTKAAALQPLFVAVFTPLPLSLTYSGTLMRLTSIVRPVHGPSVNSAP